MFHLRQSNGMQIRSRDKPTTRGLLHGSNQSHSDQSTTSPGRQQIMMLGLSAVCSLIFLSAGVNAAGVGEAWQITPYLKSVYPDHHLFWPRFDSSAFEVRTVSGVGRLSPLDESRSARKYSDLATPSPVEQNTLTDVEKTSHSKNKNIERFRTLLKNLSGNEDEVEDEDTEDSAPIQKMLQKTLLMGILDEEEEEEEDDDESTNEAREIVRVRRQAENETSMEKVSTNKSVREARLNSPETWSSSVQPISVEFRHRIPLDQVIRQQQEEEETAALSNSYRRHQAPRVDFVTGQHQRRNYPEYRESRDMPITRNYDDYDQMSWYRNAIREREYEYPSYRRGYSYQYPERYRMERDYYARPPNNDQHYYDRYRDDSDFDVYGRNRATPKPRRIIYYTTLPEVVRKPVDLRNYPRYDKTSVSRDGAHKPRVPGNVDPGRYRYRQYGYDPYAKRSSYYDRPYEYPESDSRKVRVSTKENLSSERKVSNLIAIRDNDGKLPWPVQIGTEVSIKDDERIPGRKIFGESNVGYDRFQSAQLQKAPDATGSSELQSDN